MKHTYTEQQTHAIEHYDSRDQAIIARAGCGKTTVAAAKIRHLIENHCATDCVIAVTFTRAGGRTLHSRVAADVAWSGTLHALALRHLDIDPRNILTEPEETDLIAAILDESNLSTVTPAALKASMCQPRRAIGDIGLLQRTLRTRLANAGKMTFDMVLQEFLAELRKGSFEEITDSHLVVDEAQDTSPLDAEIYRHLAGEHGKICAIGDPAQAIYGFRGATESFLRMTANRGTRTPLTRSFRCARIICRAAELFLPEAEHITSDRDASGTLRIETFENERDEEDHIMGLANMATRSDSSIAILARYNATVDRLRRAFVSAGIPIAPRIGGSREPGTMAACAQFFRAVIAGDIEGALAAHPNPDVLQRKWPRMEGLVGAFTASQHHPRTLLDVVNAPAEWTGHPAANAGSPEAALEALVMGHQIEPKDDQGIHIETIHGAKGREWDHVVLAAADTRMDTKDPQGDNLAYVAITRARDSFTATYSKTVTDYQGRPISRNMSRIIATLTDLVD